MVVRVIETLGTAERSGEIEAYLTGLVDLGWVENLYLKRASGRAVRLAHREDPADFASLRHALEGETIEGAEIVTVVLLPDDFGEYVGFESARKILVHKDVPVDASLLLCLAADPEGGEETAAWSALEQVNSLGEIWDRQLILSPEDRARLDQVAQLVGREDMGAHAAASAAVLAGAVDPMAAVSSLPPSNADQYRLVRTFARGADMEGVVRQLVSSVLDDDRRVFEGERLAVMEENPPKLIADVVAELTRTHNLSFPGVNKRDLGLVVGLWAAVRMLWEYVSNGLRRLPRRLIDRGRAEAIGRLETAVTRVVLGDDPDESELRLVFGGPRTPRPATPSELDDGLIEFRREMAETADASRVSTWLPESPPVSEAQVWDDLTASTFVLLDGGSQKPQPLVPADRFAVKPPLPARLQTLVQAAIAVLPADANQRASALVGVNDIPFPFLSTDPWRLESLARILAEAGHTPAVGVSSGTNGDDKNDVVADPDHGAFEVIPGTGGVVDEALAGLKEIEREARESYVYRVGLTLLSSLDVARRSFVTGLAELGEADERTQWSDQPERSARRRVQVIATIVFLAIVGAAGGWLAGLLPGVAAAGLVGLALVVGVLGFLWTASAYQTAAFLRDHLLRRREALFGEIREAWNAIHRFNTLYRQYRHWAAILSADVHRPVGRPGEIVVFGAQQTRPRWLVTARSMSIQSGETERIRRATFQCGWRGRAFTSTYRDLLDGYTTEQGLTESPDPRADVLDAYGSRRFLIDAFVLTERSARMKRDLLENQVRSELVRAGGGLARPDQVTEVIGRYGTPYPSLEDFFDLGQNDRFAAYVPERSKRLHRDVGSPRELESSTVTRPAVLGDSERGRDAERSGRVWPQLCSVRIDASPPLALVQREPDGTGGGEVDRQVDW